MEPETEEDIAFPTELSNVPFQNLGKYTNDFATSVRRIRKHKKIDDASSQYHRDNKNRPREISSKKPAAFLKSNVSSVQRRDPRFDSSCGSFDQEAFDENFKFLNKLKKKERKILHQKLNDPETSPEERVKIESLLQRQKNQIREQKRKNKEKELLEEKRNYEISLLKQGKRPFYQKKSAQKLLQLAEQFEELKNKGALTKHLKRRRKERANRDKKKIDIPI